MFVRREEAKFMTAVELHAAITRVRENGVPIGRCVSDEREFELEHRNFDENIEGDDEDDAENAVEGKRARVETTEKQVMKRVMDFVDTFNTAVIRAEKLADVPDAGFRCSAHLNFFPVLGAAFEAEKNKRYQSSSQHWGRQDKPPKIDEPSADYVALCSATDLTIATGAFSWTLCWNDFSRYTNAETAKWEMSYVKLLYDNAPEIGTYGDIAALETKIDPQVRDARDYFYGRHFSVSDALLRKVAQAWYSSMYPREGAIRVVPYKINVYPPDGHFAVHTDTPELNMIGTILVGLGEEYPQDLRQRFAMDKDWKWEQTTEMWKNRRGYEDAQGRRHHLDIVGSGDEIYWESPILGQTCCFYTDVQHKVNATGTYRATLSFKVFLDNPELCRDRISVCLLEMARDKLPRDRTVGFLLSHKYSYNSLALKGCDAHLQSVLEQSGIYKVIELVPVLLHTAGVQDDDNCKDIYLDKISCRVFLLTDEALQNVGQVASMDVPFFKVSGGYEWSYKHDEGAEHAGNNARGEDIDSVYLHKAFICHV